MKHLLTALILIISLSSCGNERIIQLPETQNKDILEINDVSSIYLFYDEAKDSVEFNRKNMISTTNWLVAIDKRINLKQALPHLQYLHEKRHGDGMHKNEAARNYFSCSNPDIKNLAFIDFTDTKFIEESASMHQSKSSTLLGKRNVILEFSSQNKITIHNISDSLSMIKSSKFSFINDIKSNLETEDAILKLDFNNLLTFQDYIDIKSELLKLNMNNLIISDKEFIHN